VAEESPICASRVIYQDLQKAKLSVQVRQAHSSLVLTTVFAVQGSLLLAADQRSHDPPVIDLSLVRLACIAVAQQSDE
jgi:hypothetical protein